MADEAVLVGNLMPVNHDLYEKFQPDGEKNEHRKKMAMSFDLWVKASRQNTMMFSLLLGMGDMADRMGRILESGGSAKHAGIFLRRTPSVTRSMK